jgi:hypothetical protein
MKNIWVDCYRGNVRLRSYDFGFAEPIDNSKVGPPDEKELIAQAKMLVEIARESDTSGL